LLPRPRMTSCGAFLPWLPRYIVLTFTIAQ
jgi:hypothetical protein